MVDDPGPQEDQCPVCGGQGEHWYGYSRFECDGLAEAHEGRGARQERDRIAAWHRAKAEECRQEARNEKGPLSFVQMFAALARFHDDAADALERGEHEEQNDG